MLQKDRQAYIMHGLKNGVAKEQMYRILLESFSSEYCIYKHRKVNTYRRMEIWSVIDVTFIRDTLTRDLQWHVSENYTQPSDHDFLNQPMFENKLVPEDNCKMSSQQI